jgi:hypothetical protein
MKFILVISHVISQDLNQICEPFEILILLMGFFYNFDHKYAMN